MAGGSHAAGCTRASHRPHAVDNLPLAAPYAPHPPMQDLPLLIAAPYTHISTSPPNALCAPLAHCCITEHYLTLWDGNRWPKLGERRGSPETPAAAAARATRGPAARQELVVHNLTTTGCMRFPLIYWTVLGEANGKLFLKKYKLSKWQKQLGTVGLNKLNQLK